MANLETPIKSLSVSIQLSEHINTCISFPSRLYRIIYTYILYIHTCTHTQPTVHACGHLLYTFTSIKIESVFFCDTKEQKIYHIRIII